MPMYSIAGLKVFMEPRFDKTQKQSEQYKIDYAEADEADILIDYPDRAIERWGEIAPEFNDESKEYMSFGTAFYKGLINFDGIMLHSSAVVYEGKAYLFSAKSGTGKSTHTQLWLKHFGEDAAYILNDDKPAIRKIDGRYYACGTPFSGKTDLSRNELVPLQAICVIKRGAENKISKLDVDEALYSILNQTLRPAGETAMAMVLDIIDGIVKEVPVYELYCNISEEAVEVAYEGMKN